MIKKFFSMVTVIVGVILISGVTFAAGPFYGGKTIRIIVGATPGGGYDINARVIARHMGKHIPGNPTVIVENMPGAGQLISANYLYKVAKPDGLTIGCITGSLIFNQLCGEPGVECDYRKFEYLGANYQGHVCTFFTKASGITSVDKWMASKTPVKVGGIGRGVTVNNVFGILKEVLGLPTQIISGYKSTPEIFLAAESGELAGTGVDWETMKVTKEKALKTGDWIAVLQGFAHPELSNVPVAINFAKTDEARKLIEVGIHIPSIITRPFMTPPGIPKERVEILRKAFEETLNDKEFLAETGNMKLGIDPVTGTELREVIERLFNVDPALLAKLKPILF